MRTSTPSLCLAACPVLLCRLFRAHQPLAVPKCRRCDAPKVVVPVEESFGPRLRAQAGLGSNGSAAGWVYGNQQNLMQCSLWCFGDNCVGLALTGASVDVNVNAAVGKLD